MLAGNLLHRVDSADGVDVDAASANERDAALHHLGFRRIVVGKAENAGHGAPSFRAYEGLQRIAVRH
jgi:hypothetical protein